MLDIATIVFLAVLGVSLHPRLKGNYSLYVQYVTLILLCVLTIISSFTPMGIFIKHVSLFHIGEWLFVRNYHTAQLKFDSFLLNNSKAYTACMLMSVAENFAGFAILRNIPYTFGIGSVAASAGLVARWMALYTAGRNFTHLIAERKDERHKLVTRGIYRYCRHPGYAGWFWWTLGLQLVLGNMICFVLFSFISWKFFKSRIDYEERLLESFFGREYIMYRDQSSTWIPFIE